MGCKISPRSSGNYTRSRSPAPSKSVAVTRMKAVQVVARGRAEFVDVPVPSVQPGHVLVRTRQLSLCGSDIRMLHFAPEDAYPFPPGTTGHEMVGVIEDIDAPGSALQVGDSVLYARAEPSGDGGVFPGAGRTRDSFAVRYSDRAIAAGSTTRNGAVCMPASAKRRAARQSRSSARARRACSSIINCDKWGHDASSPSTSKPFGLRFRSSSVPRTRSTMPSWIRATQSDKSMAANWPTWSIEVAGDVSAINLAIDLVRHGGDILYFGYPRGQTIPFNFDGCFTNAVARRQSSEQRSNRIRPPRGRRST